MRYFKNLTWLLIHVGVLFSRLMTSMFFKYLSAIEKQCKKNYNFAAIHPDIIKMKMKKYSYFSCILLVVSWMGCLTLSSCSTMAEMAGDMLWNDMANAALNAKPSSTTSKGAPLSRKERKEQEKEKERLQKEGKCLSCHGYGKTPDGKYTCPVCNGTGILQEEKK